MEISPFLLNDETWKDDLILKARLQDKVFFVLSVLLNVKKSIYKPQYLFGAVFKYHIKEKLIFLSERRHL